MRRQSHAAQIGHDDRVIADQDGRERRPHVASVAKAMQQQNGGAFAADAHMKCGGFRADVGGAKARRERLDVGVRRNDGREQA